MYQCPGAPICPSTLRSPKTNHKKRRRTSQAASRACCWPPSRRFWDARRPGTRTTAGTPARPNPRLGARGSDNRDDNGHHDDDNDDGDDDGGDDGDDAASGDVEDDDDDDDDHDDDEVDNNGEAIASNVVGVSGLSLGKAGRSEERLWNWT